MAIVQNPITGRSSGKFANAIFYTVLSMNILRSKPIEVANPNTLAQQKARKKLSTLSKLAKAFRDAAYVGYYDDAIRMYPRNYYMKANKEAVAVSDMLAVTITWADLVTAKGDITTIETFTAEVNGGDIDFTWTLSTPSIPANWKVAIVLSDRTIAGTRVYMAAEDADQLSASITTSAVNAGDYAYMFVYDPVTYESSDSVMAVIAS